MLEDVADGPGAARVVAGIAKAELGWFREGETSPCGATGREMTLELEGGRATAVHPAEAVLSFMAVIDPGDIRGSGCDQQNFFVSADVATDWLDELPGGFVLPVADAHELLVHLRGGAAQLAGSEGSVSVGK